MKALLLFAMGLAPMALVGINGVIAGELRLLEAHAHSVTLSDGRMLRPEPFM